MITLRRASTWLDAWRLYRWRNDLSTRCQMRNTARVGLLEHWRWFRADDPKRHIFIAHAHGRAIGTVSMNVSAGGRRAEVSITVARRFRGRGYAPAMLLRLTGEARRLGVVRFVAYIRSHNTASTAAFKAAGYVETYGFDQGWTRMDLVCRG